MYLLQEDVQKTALDNPWVSFSHNIHVPHVKCQESGKTISLVHINAVLFVGVVQE